MSSSFTRVGLFADRHSMRCALTGERIEKGLWSPSSEIVYSAVPIKTHISIHGTDPKTGKQLTIEELEPVELERKTDPYEAFMMELTKLKEQNALYESNWTEASIGMAKANAEAKDLTGRLKAREGEVEKLKIKINEMKEFFKDALEKLKADKLKLLAELDEAKGEPSEDSSEGGAEEEDDGEDEEEEEEQLQQQKPTGPKSDIMATQSEPESQSRTATAVQLGAPVTSSDGNSKRPLGQTEQEDRYKIARPEGALGTAKWPIVLDSETPGPEPMPAKVSQESISSRLGYQASVTLTVTSPLPKSDPPIGIAANESGQPASRSLTAPSRRPAHEPGNFSIVDSSGRTLKLENNVWTFNTHTGQKFVCPSRASPDDPDPFVNGLITSAGQGVIYNSRKVFALNKHDLTMPAEHGPIVTVKSAQGPFLMVLTQRSLDCINFERKAPVFTCDLQQFGIPTCMALLGKSPPRQVFIGLRKSFENVIVMDFTSAGFEGGMRTSVLTLFSSPTLGIAVSPDGRYVVAVSARGFSHVPRGRGANRVEFGNSFVKGCELAFDSTGKQLAVLSTSRTEVSVYLFDSIRRDSHPKVVKTLHSSRQARKLVWTGKNIEIIV